MSDIKFGENPEVNWEPNTYFDEGVQFTYIGVRYLVTDAHNSGNTFSTSLPYLTTNLPITALPESAAGVLTNDGSGNLTWGAGGGGGGVTLPADSSGHLANDGSGGLSWVTPPSVTIQDNLTTASGVQALSANQGLILKGYLDNLVTLSGNALDAVHNGTFSGTTITDNVTVKVALQELELAIESASTAKQSVVADIAARDALVGPATGDLAYAVDASADATVVSGSALYVYDGAAWQKISEFESLDFALSNLIPLVGASVGLAGVSTELSRADHVHPFQGVSADANNFLTVGPDGLHHYNSGSRVFATETAVGPATPGSPLLSEVQAVVTAGSTVDRILYYTGSDSAADPTTHIYIVDGSGVVTLVKEPSTPPNDRLFLSATATAAANVNFPTNSEITTAIGVNRNTVVYYTGSDAILDDPTFVFHVDASGNLTRLEQPNQPSINFNNTTDWGAAAGGYYTMTILQSTHAIDFPATVTVMEDDGGDNVIVQPDRVAISASQNVTIRVTEAPDARFTGSVLIR